MLDKDIIKALQICEKAETPKDCINCRFTHSGNCISDLSMWALRIINRQKAEIEELQMTLSAVMLSVDKWLEGDELGQIEINRAVIMREKTLQIIEQQQAEIEKKNTEIDRLSIYLDELVEQKLNKAKSKAIREFAERLKAEKYYTGNRASRNGTYAVEVADIDKLVKEMTEG